MNTGRYKITLVKNGRFWTRIDYGTWDELKTKYGKMAVRIEEI